VPQFFSLNLHLFPKSKQVFGNQFVSQHLFLTQFFFASEWLYP
jgi:hypothetical protein